MGLFSILFGHRPKPPINIDHGLSYRIVNPFKVEVLIEPKWCETCGQSEDMGKPKRASLATITKYNAEAACKTESEAFAVAEVLEQMEHFCEHCGEEVPYWRKKCEECKKVLWQGRKKLEMVVVHVP
jgi:hypothetical protein